MHYYQHHIGDFIKDTNFLSNEEVGIYLKLLWLYYDTEEPLPNNLELLSKKVGAYHIKDKVQELLNCFFNLQEGFWHHARCDQEITDYHEFIQSKSRAGKASAQRRANTRPTDVEQALNDRSTTVQLTTNHKPLTNNQYIEPKSPKGSLVCPDDVESSVWHDYLKIRKAKKLPITETALNGLRREAKKADISLSDALKVCCERGWIGFKADWYKPAIQKQELPLGSPEQIEYAYRVECGGDPTKARFANYHEMRKFITDQREKRLKANA
jgi:uncharacterized protein YdaU (DUF1376 family)